MRTQVAAKRYASALYAEAKAAGCLSSVVEKLEGFALLERESNDFNAFIKNPVISKEDKAKVITALGEKGILDKFTCTFLVMLARKNRLELLGGITECLKEFTMDERGEAIAEVVSAVELSPSLINEVEAALGALTGRKITAEVVVDKSIIGGITAKVGSTLYDASVLGQFNKLRDRLIS